MKIATAPVNWNSPDVPEYRAWIPVPAAAGRDGGGGLRRHRMGLEHAERPRRFGGGFAKIAGCGCWGGLWGWSGCSPAKREQEVQRGVEIGTYFHSLGESYLIAADSGDAAKSSGWQAGSAPEDGLNRRSNGGRLGAGLNELATALQRDMAFSLVFHNHVGTYIETEAETSRLLRRDRSVRWSAGAWIAVI